MAFLDLDFEVLAELQQLLALAREFLVFRLEGLDEFGLLDLRGLEGVLGLRPYLVVQVQVAG